MFKSTNKPKWDTKKEVTSYTKSLSWERKQKNAFATLLKTTKDTQNLNSFIDN